MAENTIANRTLFIADNLDVLRGMNSARVMPIEQLREETKARGTYVSRSGGG